MPVPGPSAVPATAAAGAAKTSDELLEEKKKKLAFLLQKAGIAQPAGPAAAAVQHNPQGQTLASIQEKMNERSMVITNLTVMAAVEKTRSLAAQQKTAPYLGIKAGTTSTASQARAAMLSLKIDELGRPVDEQGNVIGLPNREVISSLKVNQRMSKGQLKISKPAPDTDPSKVQISLPFVVAPVLPSPSPSPHFLLGDLCRILTTIRT